LSSDEPGNRGRVPCHACARSAHSRALSTRLKNRARGLLLDLQLHRETAMSWQISGQYAETCNCTMLCPCITSNLTATPTEGDCKAALGLRVEKGSKDGVALDGVSFLVVLQSKGPMGAGN